MACFARSVQLSCDENVGLRSFSRCNFKRWSQGRNPIIFQDVTRMKMRCRGRKLTYTKLMGAPANFHHSKLGNSGVISCRLEENSSNIVANAGMPKVLHVASDWLVILWKDVNNFLFLFHWGCIFGYLAEVESFCNGVLESYSFSGIHFFVNVVCRSRWCS